VPRDGSCGSTQSEAVYRALSRWKTSGSAAVDGRHAAPLLLGGTPVALSLAGEAVGKRFGGVEIDNGDDEAGHRHRTPP
jgi:hypothetical protein